MRTLSWLLALIACIPSSTFLPLLRPFRPNPTTLSPSTLTSAHLNNDNHKATDTTTSPPAPSSPALSSSPVTPSCRARQLTKLFPVPTQSITSTQLIEALEIYSQTPSPKKSTTAFPQPIPLTPTTLSTCCSVTTGLTTLTLAYSVSPNLWLVGYLAGSLYGTTASRRASTNTIDRLIIRYGTILAQYWVKCLEFFNSMFFLYKTGQLSYDYWKRYVPHCCCNSAGLRARPARSAGTR